MRRNKGFTLIEGLLILVIVSILGGTGWYVWNAKNTSSESVANANAASNSYTTPGMTKQFDILKISMQILPGWTVKETTTNQDGDTTYDWEVSNPKADGEIQLSAGGFRGGFEGCADESGNDVLTEFTVNDVAATANTGLSFLSYGWGSDNSNHFTGIVKASQEYFHATNGAKSPTVKNSALKKGTYYGCLGDPGPGFLNLSNRQLKNAATRDTIGAYDIPGSTNLNPPLSFSAKSFKDVKTMLTSVK